MVSRFPKRQLEKREEDSDNLNSGGIAETKNVGSIVRTPFFAPAREKKITREDGKKRIEN